MRVILHSFLVVWDMIATNETSANTTMPPPQQQ